MRERTSVRDRRRRPHDVERIRLSEGTFGSRRGGAPCHVTQRGTVLDPLGLIGDLVVRDAARDLRSFRTASGAAGLVGWFKVRL